jgi:hypothetical protein
MNSDLWILDVQMLTYILIPCFIVVSNKAVIAVKTFDTKPFVFSNLIFRNMRRRVN